MYRRQVRSKSEDEKGGMKKEKETERERENGGKRDCEERDS